MASPCGEAIFVARYFDLMVTVNELLFGLVSVPWNVAEPVVEMVAACVITQLMVTTMVWPPGNDLAEQVTVPPAEPEAGPLQLPIVLLAEVNCRFDGSVLVKTTLGAVTVPWLFLICQV